jgi:broad specificity phosphatase PhoE
MARFKEDAMSDVDRNGAAVSAEPVLVLVKHAMPILEPDVPARQWVLGDEGRRQSHALAQQLARFRPVVVVNSVEPKAKETAETVAADLGCTTAVVPGLHEHERANVGWLGGGELTRAVELFFANPDAVVFGTESASAARRRFGDAVDGLLRDHPGQNLIVVAHGTVISLFVAERAGVDGFALWRRLTCPSYVVLARADLRLQELVEHAAPPRHAEPAGESLP